MPYEVHILPAEGKRAGRACVPPLPKNGNCDVIQAEQRKNNLSIMCLRIGLTFSRPKSSIWKLFFDKQK